MANKYHFTTHLSKACLRPKIREECTLRRLLVVWVSASGQFIYFVFYQKAEGQIRKY